MARATVLGKRGLARHVGVTWRLGDGGVLAWRGVAGRQGLGVAVSRRGTARCAGVAWGSVVARALRAALKRRGGSAGSCTMWQGDVAESRRAVGGGWALRSALSGVAGQQGVAHRLGAAWW
ncbi:hypothetical protein EDB84DRAFT_1447241 [Lactarius hengduanensis]|nr:hypothetical protein EDB84DRAFT_1447241 [Lactarius hengduanensis]